MKKISVIFVLLFSIFFFTTQTDAAGSSQLLIINKKINTLAYYDGGKLVKTFKVATGRSRDLTPEGNFRIVNKIVNRPYYTGNIPGGDPRNPLGNRWMGLEARGTYGTTYGIHGNANESSIGKYVSSGCVRMHNEEIRWLYDKIQMYTPVIITYSDSSFDAIAKANGYSVSTNGWVLANGKWYFYSNGVAQKGWLSQGGTWYFLDNSGVMKTGWVLNNGKWYFLEKSGAMKTGWLLTGGKWYFLEKSGAMKTGWLSNSGKWYYLETSGAMKTGWLKTGNEWYYLDAGGAMKTGWISLSGKWYYLESSGAMKTGWLDKAGKKYFLTGSGAMATGWLKMDGKWYYLYTSGEMAAKTTINGYILGEDGVWVQVDYVALGDSLAAGITPDGKKDLGYPDYIANNFKKSYDLLDFANFGVSGYKTADLIEQLKKADVQKEIKAATHITLDIGANDLLPVLQTNPAQAPEVIGTVAANLNTILSTIDQLNPKVKVYVMGYYNPFLHYPQEQQAPLLPLLEGLNGQIKAQAIQHGDTFVPTEKVIAVNFKEYLPVPESIHLSLTGYQALAGEFWKVMK
ncbi:L,D-transpeptidase family protein [Neobacillus vireti]|uniref:Cell surface protein n=1 Tax=Neobacillus vireti LMG 21834 TaxID=1131730 RepID=A0AB94IHS0_9BACI|nr:L,D-transpeptidase family protein [Neobacillus vireti]ETI66592.1 cell surface protein [Neobacillus vireti LMG 21834]